MEGKYSKCSRVLDMYARLCEGKVLNKKEEAYYYGVDERSVQRDIDDIRTFLADHKIEGHQDNRTIIYDRAQNGFSMLGDEDTHMTNDEVLAISKILLESRAFTKREISSILDKMIKGCVPEKSMKLVADMISNEKYHYVELRHKSDVNKKLWRLGEEIRDSNLIELIYRKQMSSKETVKRIIQPVALIFSEYYFYLIAFIVERDEKGFFRQKYDYPAVFRVDRIINFHEIGEKFKIWYSNRFEEGEFRKRVQFMIPGELTKIRVRYIGRNVEAVLDRLPTAAIITEDSHGTIIEAQVYGRGIMMWILSQGANLELLYPESMRSELKKILQEMINYY